MITNKGSKTDNKTGNRKEATIVHTTAINPKARTPVQVKIKNSKILVQKKKIEAINRPHKVKLSTIDPLTNANAIWALRISSSTMIKVQANDRNIQAPLLKIYSPKAASLSAWYSLIRD